MSNLKCPFCGEKLYKSNDCHVCFNANCIFANNYLFDEKWWAIIKLKQALIQAKQDLRIARNALKDARIFADTHCIATAVKTIDKALTQIEHKE